MSLRKYIYTYYTNLYVHGFDRQTKVSSGIDSAINYYDKGSSDHELHSYVRCNDGITISKDALGRVLH